VEGAEVAGAVLGALGVAAGALSLLDELDASVDEVDDELESLFVSESLLPLLSPSPEDAFGLALP